MDASEESPNILVHFVGPWPDADTKDVLTYINSAEPILTPGRQVVPEAKPWTMICHDSFDPVIYLASRIGIPGVFRAHTPTDLIRIIRSFVDEMNDRD